MILVLLAAAALSLAASGGEDWLDGVIILVIVVVNGVISITQEDHANLDIIYVLKEVLLCPIFVPAQTCATTTTRYPPFVMTTPSRKVLRKIGINVV